MQLHRYHILPGFNFKTLQAGMEQTLVRLPTERFRRYYLDSDQWHLLAAHYYLCADHRHGSFRLQLYDTRNEQLICQYQYHQLPQTLQDLGSSQLAAQLATLLQQNRLLPQLDLMVNRMPSVIQDEQQKTVCRFLQETETLKHRQPSLSLPSLIVEYSDDFTSELPQGKKFGLAPVNTSRIDQWLQLTAPVSSKPDHHINLSMTCLEAARVILLQQLQRMQDMRPVILQDEDPEGIHQFRVAMRRSRALISQLPGIFHPGELAPFIREFKYMGQLTGALRDLDVMLAQLPDYQQQLNKKHAHALQILPQLLQPQRQQAYQAVCDYLNSSAYLDFHDRWHHFLQQPPHSDAQTPNALLPVHAVSRQFIWKTYKKLLKQGKRIHDHSEDEKLHTLRKTGKQLRYLIEFFSSLQRKKDIKKIIAILKGLQDNLGQFQDLHTQQQQLQQLHELLQQQGSDKPTRHALKQLQQSLRAQQQQCRQRFADCFNAFNQPEHQTLFKKLYQP